MLQTSSKNSQLVAWLQEQQKPHRLREVMARERHSEFIKQAEEKGYLLSPSQDFLLEQYRSDNSNASINDIVQVHLSKMRLKGIGDLGLCQNLQYCSLPGNYITNFEALKTCTSLVRLDLHDNQISTLPGSDFWQSLLDLKVLYLHNNSLGRLSCLQKIGASPNLQVLTLFDTPMSLKNSYRHHVVNSIYSLKALDFHVISDEEIIEDAVFGSHFSAMHSSFKFNPLIDLKKERCMSDEMKTIRQILLKVSLIQAKHSPVIIIQRYIRGFLGRCRAEGLIANRVWAAVAIQRYWRKYKGYKYVSKKLKKNACKSAKKKDQVSVEPKAKPKVAPHLASSHAKSSNQSPSNRYSREACVAGRGKLDYDTYMKNRRPGSISPGFHSINNQQYDVTPQVAVVQEFGRNTSSPTGRHRANIVIDLTKLEAATQLVPITSSLSGIHEYTSTCSQFMVPHTSSLLQPQDIERDTSKLKAEFSASIVSKKHKSLSVYDMLGPLDDKDLIRETEESFEEESPPFRFRIAGFQSVLHVIDPTQELLMERRETGKDMRCTHRDVIDNILQPTPLIKRNKKKLTANQRLFAKIQGTMGMASLKAVQQAYKDREKAESTIQKSDYILSLRAERDQRRERRCSYLEEKRLTVLQNRDQDVCKLAESLKQRATLKQDELKKAKEMRFKGEDRTKSLNQEMLFASDFSGQHSSISKALLKHDRQVIKTELLQTNDRIVKSERENQRSQAELVQRYLEHRKLMRQAQVTIERAALDAKIMQETNNRLLQSQSRVVHQKQTKKTVQAFYPLPKSATDPVLTAVAQEGKPNRFETLISMYDGRVGNHPADHSQY